MMKGLFCFCLMLLLPVQARAAELPGGLKDSFPKAAEDILWGQDFSGADAVSQGIGRILRLLPEQAEEILRGSLRGAVMILLIVVLCGAAECLDRGTGSAATVFLPMAGALSVTIATAGTLDSMIGAGAEVIRELSVFSKALLPTLAAAMAASGSVTAAGFHQVTTVFLVDLLVSLIEKLLLPLVYLYIGVLTAATCLPESRLNAIANGVKKAVVWLLTTSLLLFTVYLSVIRVIAGTADSTAVKMTKTAISGVVPVVGSIISEASETVLLGAGMLKNTIGIAGMLVILATCVYPFLQLGVQYLLYKLTAFLASVTGPPRLCGLIDGLGGAFGLVLGMAGSCALLLLISVLSSIAAVVL
ncbi:MAG: stage III sporulation protein AE [Ruminococcaceae bacterium]|nr:stage III sporulation protein AE [Oscillospiraceae bacterium]